MPLLIPRWPACAIVVFALTSLPAVARAEDASDEPPVERGKVEAFGATGRLFDTDGRSRFFLLSRQPFAAEHGAGFSGEFRIVTQGATPAQQTSDYEVICDSTRTGYHPLRVKGPGGTRDSYVLPDVSHRPATGGARAMYNLYWAACRKQFGKFR